MLVTVNVQTAR